jgi:hypothetical protein
MSGSGERHMPRSREPRSATEVPGELRLRTHSLAPKESKRQPERKPSGSFDSSAARNLRWASRCPVALCLRSGSRGGSAPSKDCTTVATVVSAVAQSTRSDRCSAALAPPRPCSPGRAGNAIEKLGDRSHAGRGLHDQRSPDARSAASSPDWNTFPDSSFDRTAMACTLRRRAGSDARSRQRPAAGVSGPLQPGDRQGAERPVRQPRGGRLDSRDRALEARAACMDVDGVTLDLRRRGRQR